MRTNLFLVCRTCGGQIEIGTKNHIEGRQVCRKCLEQRIINEDAYLRTYHLRKCINESNRSSKANI